MKNLLLNKDFSEGLQSYDSNLYSKLFLLEKGNFWFEYRNRLIYWILQKYFSSCESFLEVGCGTGFVLEMFKRSKTIPLLFGSDLFKDGLEFASERVPQTYFFQLNLMEKIPFINEFNVIGGFDVLEHIEDDFIAINNIYTACKPGGGVIITVPQHKLLWSKSDEIACHFRRYEKKELIFLIQKAGFDVVFVSSFISLLFPLMLISRLFPFSSKNRTVLDELKIGFILNLFFKIVCKIEYIIIKTGIKIPIGGSLLIVGKKKVE
ncbi:hypothetical protein AXG55_12005 [Silvanigrella aquatica]|uniref:Methyltransferase domain-containing protein n=1 Tax=Silvanigrella aquatica TaxID=1915309 RepID=A0A1L4D4Q4_9BACT|nr:hypothetical protein AXG55_12005 [Silvanigrella aquatica]